MDNPLGVKHIKSYVVMGSGVALGLVAFAAYRYFKSPNGRTIDEGFEDVSRLDYNPERRVLVLGLTGSGKSSIVSKLGKQITRDKTNRPPTALNVEAQKKDAFDVILITDGDQAYNIWDMCGGKREIWTNYTQDTDLLVYVVDASDRETLSLAGTELKRILGDERLARVPLLVFANKQDQPGALSTAQVSKALDIDSLRPLKHTVQVIGTQVPEGTNSHISQQEAWKAIVRLSSSVA